ncbi:hypothetical protein [Streptomyces sp. B4I13]|uniref:hypothetical protein n=1 Tax=Streptomyces sp. B4I13 TaxID=3042271 RepID=UPI0027D8E979|nr:hypothetical protein [Streptomyces sp. B4I13]
MPVTDGGGLVGGVRAGHQRTQRQGRRSKRHDSLRRASYAGASFVLNRTQKSAVNPSLARGPCTVLHTSAGLWTYDRSGVFNGRYLPLAPLPGSGVLPAGTYRLNMQKLDSPLRSLSTPWFNVVVTAP